MGIVQSVAGVQLNLALVCLLDGRGFEGHQLPETDLRWRRCLLIIGGFEPRGSDNEQAYGQQ